MGELELWPMLAVLASAVLGGAVQSTLGFGASFTLVPTLALIEPELLPGTVIVAIVPMTTLMILRDHEGFDGSAVLRVTAGRLPGIALGGAVVALLSVRWLTALIALILLLAVLSSAAGWSLRITRPREVAAGLVSGITGTAAALGGPPMALLYRDKTASVLRPTLAGVWLAGTFPAIGSLLVAGSFTGRHAEAGVLLGVAMLLGMTLMAPLVARISDTLVRQMVLVWASVGAVSALLRSVLSG